MLEQRFIGLAGEIDFTVGIVFDDGKVMLFRQLNQLLTTGITKNHATGVTERRHDVHKLDRVVLQQNFQIVYDHAVFIGTNRQNIRLRQLQHLQGGKIGRTFDDHFVARIDQRSHQNIQRLLGPIGHQNGVGRGLNASLLTQLSDRFPQRRKTFTQTVLERIQKLVFHHVTRGHFQPCIIKQFRAGNTAAQRYHTRHFAMFE